MTPISDLGDNSPENGYPEQKGFLQQQVLLKVSWMENHFWVDR